MKTRDVLALALLLVPSSVRGQMQADVLFAEAREEVFVRMISERLMLGPRLDVCLGLGGATTPVEDPTPGVTRRVIARTADLAAEMRFTGEIKPFSECDTAGFGLGTRSAGRAIPVIVEHLSLSADQRGLTVHGHVGLTGENTLDCRIDVDGSGGWEVEKCGVWHRHFGYSLKYGPGAGRPQ